MSGGLTRRRVAETPAAPIGARGPDRPVVSEPPPEAEAESVPEQQPDPDPEPEPGPEPEPEPEREPVVVVPRRPLDARYLAGLPDAEDLLDADNDPGDPGDPEGARGRADGQGTGH